MRSHRPVAIDVLERRQLLSTTPAATDLARFDFADGANPAGGTYRNAAGDLFGVAAAGPTVAASTGVLWELPAGSATITDLATFSGTAQQDVNGGIVADAAGNLYGTFEGNHNRLVDVYTHGGVWKYTAATGTLATVALFDGTDGDIPATDAITIDAAGNLYGTTQTGGAADDGTAWELPAGGTAIGLLASFDAAVGSDPVGQIVRTTNGTLYGVTQVEGPGTDALGTIWSLAPTATAVTVVSAFDNGSTGTVPTAGLATDGAGHLFGSTVDGGADGYGAVFEVDATATPAAVSVLAPLTAAESPLNGELAVSATDVVYGAGNTTVFSVANGVVQPVATLGDLNTPTGPLLLTPAGDLIGTAYDGGDTTAADGTTMSSSGFGGVYTVPAATLTTNVPVLEFTTVPATAQARDVFQPADREYTHLADLGTIKVLEYTNSGTLAIVGTDDTGTVTLTAGGSSYGLPTTATAPLVDGVATFTGLTLLAGTDSTEASPGGTITLTATSGADTVATSSPITVTPSTTPTAGALAVTVAKSTVPTTVVTGTAAAGTATVTLANNGTSTIAGPAIVSVYASTTGVIDADSVVVGTTTRLVNVRASRSVNLPVRVRLPKTLAASTYTLLTRIDVSGGLTSPATFPATVTVAAANVSLTTATVAAVPATVPAGGSATVVFSVANAGNVAATGPVTITVDLSAGGTVLTTATRSVTVAAGRTLLVKLRVKVPAGTAAGTYTPTVTLVRNGVTAAMAAGAATLTVG